MPEQHRVERPDHDRENYQQIAAVEAERRQDGYVAADDDHDHPRERDRAAQGSRHEMASRYNSHDSPTITAGAVVAMSATLIAVVKVSALYSKWYKKFIVSEPISTSLSQLRRTKSRRASTCGNAQGLNAMTPINQDQKTSAAAARP